VLLLDRAGWHTTGALDVTDNITPIFLPSRAPELNPVENVWQYLRSNWLSNRVFETPSSTPPVRLGRTSPQHPKRSLQLECANGHTSVRSHDLWFFT
jgi:transposase